MSGDGYPDRRTGRSRADGGFTTVPLLPCPFCGSEPAIEPSPWMEECFRVACSSRACRVTPRTEYLLARYADELCAAWNGRSAPPAGRRDG